MKYSAYLFDWDGTLLNSLPAWYEVFQELVAHGQIKDLTPIQQRNCYNRWDNVRDYVEISDEKWADMLRHATEFAKKRIKNIELVPGAREMLALLHKNNCKTALVTRAFREVVGNMLEEHGLMGGFDAVITYEDVKEHKPDPEPLFKAMEELGVNPDETVMVGDSETDLIAGKRANVDTFLFFPQAHEKYYKKVELLEHDPKEVFASWEEFTSLVE
jgi:HAD superfamily hydrolase (TIGR01509 family)